MTNRNRPESPQARPLTGTRGGRGRWIRRLPWRWIVVAGVATTIVASGAVWTNALGAGDRFEGLVARIEMAIDPPPDRPTLPTVTVTAAPSPGAAPTPTLPVTAPSDDPARPASPTPAPTPTPTPIPREPVDIDILADPAAPFASQLTKDWCAPAGVQMVLAILGHTDTSDAVQNELARRIGEWESLADSRNGGWGPASMALALADYGALGYEIHAYETRADALRGSAAAIARTGAPAILLAWRGAHTWVMTGYRADADPVHFADATVSGAYVLDPWYPRISNIWGASDPPGTFQDMAEMERNFLPWKRPEGTYPDRDGKFIVVTPTIAVSP